MTKRNLFSIVFFCIDLFSCQDGSPFSDCESRDWRNSLAYGFSQSPFEAHEMFFLLNRFVLFVSQKQPLKCVQQNGYLDLRSNTLRRARSEVFCKIGALRNLAKFKGKHLCQSLFLNKFIKKETLAKVFSCEFCEISGSAFLHRVPLVAASLPCPGSAGWPWGILILAWGYLVLGGHFSDV